MRAEINGTLLAWEEAGAGEPVVLIHGLAEGRQAWRHQRESFSRRFRVITYDVRGFAESALGRADATPEQFAADLRELLVRLDIEQVALVGFSMGGVIAQRFAADHRELTRTVVIAASSSVINRQACDYFLQRAALADAVDVEAVRRVAADDAYANFAVSPPDVVEAYRELRRASIRDPAGYANACRAMAGLRERPLTPALAGIRCPTLVTTGERDVLCPPRASEIIHGAIPGSRLAIVPRVGHCLHWEDPEGFNRMVLDFLSSDEPPVGSATAQPPRL